MATKLLTKLIFLLFSQADRENMFIIIVKRFPIKTHSVLMNTLTVHHSCIRVPVFKCGFENFNETIKYISDLTEGVMSIYLPVHAHFHTCTDSVVCQGFKT